MFILRSVVLFRGGHGKGDGRGDFHRKHLFVAIIAELVGGEFGAAWGKFLKKWRMGTRVDGGARGIAIAVRGKAVAFVTKGVDITAYIRVFGSYVGCGMLEAREGGVGRHNDAEYRRNCRSIWERDQETISRTEELCSWEGYEEW